MISVVLYGRNDNYSFNLVKRTAMGLNGLAEVLTDEDEILFVDYNTPGHLPTLPEFVWDTLTDKASCLTNVIRISHNVHERIKGESPLPILENVSRNAALVRSNPRNHWVLSTNPDVILVLSARWPRLADLLSTLPDSFYEMPRFDIPESVWSSLRRAEPRTNMEVLRNWLVANRAAVVETIPDYRFQKYTLFDAPGDFQLAPREYFFRLRGFDESMIHYLHSDSNLAKRMWLLNGQHTDHLLGHLWVLHQDHYLSGEWSKTATTLQHNDLYQKVFHQKGIEANDPGWGLQGLPLPSFRLAEKVKRQRSPLPQLPSASNADLPLSCDIDWRLQPFYRICHYQPEILTLYLRELFQVVTANSIVSYMGQHRKTLECIREAWRKIFPQGSSIGDLAELSSFGEYKAPDILLVDCYYERPEDSEAQLRSMTGRLESQVAEGRIAKQQADGELSQFADQSDWENLRLKLLPVWAKCLSRLNLRAGCYVVLLGCNIHVPTFDMFQEMVSVLCAGGPFTRVRVWIQSLRESYRRVKSRLVHVPEGHSAFKLVGALRKFKHWASRKIKGPAPAPNRTRPSELSGRMNLRAHYIHHRLVVLQLERGRPPGSV